MEKCWNLEEHVHMSDALINQCRNPKTLITRKRI